MVGQQFSVLLRHCGHGNPNGFIHLSNPFPKATQVFGKIGFVLSVEGYKFVVNQFSVAQSQIWIRPEVRVRVTSGLRESEIELPLFGRHGLFSQRQNHRA